MCFWFDLILSVAFKNNWLWSIFESALFRDKSGRMVSNANGQPLQQYLLIFWFKKHNRVQLHYFICILLFWSETCFKNFKNCYITILAAFAYNAKCFGNATVVVSSSPFPSRHFFRKDCQKNFYQLLMICYSGSESKIGPIWLE